MAARLATFYAALFVIYGVQLPYLPVWLAARGLSPAEIGAIVSVPLFVRLLATPLAGAFADRFNQHRAVIIGLSALSLVAAVSLPFAHGFVLILLAVLVFQVAAQSSMPLAETIAMAAVRRGRLDYGPMRLWGSLTFIAANIVGGWLIESHGADSVQTMLLAAAAATLVAALVLPRADDTTASATGAPRRPLLAAMVAHLGNRSFVLFLIAAGSIQASHAVYYAFSALHWGNSGLSAQWIGLLWAIGVVVEVALFAVSRQAVAVAGALGLVVLGGAAGIVRWTATAFDPSLGWLIVLQALHGLTFGATHLGAMHLIGDLVADAEAGTAQALHATVTGGIAMGGAMLAAGWLFGRFGPLAFLAMAGLCVVGLIAAILLARSRPAAPATVAC
jgi:PPP family 3-phenylpropionic acid transporter